MYLALFYLWLLAVILPGLLVCPAGAAQVQFTDGLGGSAWEVPMKENDSLVELARIFDLGYNAITAANPGVDPYLPPPGTLVTVPTAWILPEPPPDGGIVVNLSEMRLYHFPRDNSGLVDTFPVGIGDEGWDTPIGSHRIIQKITNPAWHVPASIRAEKPELPPVVSPGPENPLGTHALRLSIGSILIHGTARPFGIGRRVSHGCIQLYPEDMVTLFNRAPVGTRVQVVRQPVKAAVVAGRVLVEVHEDGAKDLEQAAREVLKRRIGADLRVDRDKLRQALAKRSGVPTDVTRGGD